MLWEIKREIIQYTLSQKKKKEKRNTICANRSTRGQNLDICLLKGKERERKNRMRQPNQGHKIKHDNVVRLILLKDPN